MNKKLLTRIKNKILKEPAALKMHRVIKVSECSPCGTVGCIAGWAVLMDEAKKKHKSYLKIAQKVEYDGGLFLWKNTKRKAIKILKIDPAKADSLFFVNSWPSKFAEAYSQIAGGYSAQQANVAADRIDYFIKYNK